MKEDAGRHGVGALVGIIRSQYFHAKRALLQTAHREPGQSVAVRYPHGGVGSVESRSGEKPGSALDHEIGRNRDKGLER